MKFEVRVTVIEITERSFEILSHKYDDEEKARKDFNVQMNLVDNEKYSENVANVMVALYVDGKLDDSYICDVYESEEEEDE